MLLHARNGVEEVEATPLYSSASNQYFGAASVDVLNRYPSLMVKQTQRGCLQNLLGCDSRTEMLISSMQQPGAWLFYTREQSDFVDRCFCNGCHVSISHTFALLSFSLSYSPFNFRPFHYSRSRLLCPCLWELKKAVLCLRRTIESVYGALVIVVLLMRDLVNVAVIRK